LGQAGIKASTLFHITPGIYIEKAGSDEKKSEGECLLRSGIEDKEGR
jgi:hypothetical protein